MGVLSILAAVFAVVISAGSLGSAIVKLVTACTKKSSKEPKNK